MREWLDESRGRGMALGLERVSEALELLDRPDRAMTCIHVAGSNGKGSACAQILAGLCRAGYDVGMFSSPHVVRVEERVRINGRPASSEDFDKALRQVKELELELTFFEITYLVSLLVCKDAGMQVMVLETGLGGRLDATRTADVAGCLVTSVSLEHSEILGNTLEEIAREKAAIWRPGVAMIIRDPGLPSVRNAMRDEAVNARFVQVESSTAIDEAGDLAEILCKELGMPFIRRPINWPARMQLINDQVSVLLDAAHNPSGMERIMPEIASILPERWSLLFGTSPQENMEFMLAPLFALCSTHPPVEIITTEPQGGRYPGVENPIPGVLHIPDPGQAFDAFEEPTEMVVVIGSLYLCGNILTELELDSDNHLDILS